MTKTSCDGTKYMLGVVTNHVVNLHQQLEILKNANWLNVPVQVDSVKEGYKFLPVYENFEVTPNDTHVGYDGLQWPGKKVETKKYGVKYLHFDEIKASRVLDIERKIKTANEHVEFLNQKIAEWTP